MVTADNHLYLIDFGIARLFKPGQAKDTSAFGSPGYAAPEQYGKAQTTARADIYSLGATLHYMFSGRDPSENPFQFPPLDLTQYAPAGPAVANLIDQMLEMNAQKRPPGVQAIQQELQRLAQQPVQGSGGQIVSNNRSAMNTQQSHISEEKWPGQDFPADRPVRTKEYRSAGQKTLGQLQGEGEILYAQEQYGEALAVFREILQIDPNNAHAHGWEGATLYLLKQYAKALAAREQALRLGSTDKENWLGKGQALFQLKRYGEALIAFDQALQIDPNYASTYGWKAGALFHQNWYEATIAASNQAIQIDPNYAWAYSWKGAALYRLKRYKEALAAREQALRLGSTDKEDWSGKGEALFQLKRYKEAIVAFDQAIQIDPSYTEAYSWKAKALSQQRK
jgi:tetratricopeptide (TPR) repeat protein